ncbi:MAG: hypothetical protein AAF399_01090 [Bacteroidota bacterium]
MATRRDHAESHFPLLQRGNGCLFILIALLFIGCEPSEEVPYHFSEDQIPPYELPELLVDREGNRIETPAHWEQHRKDLLQQFRDEIYGHVPGELDSLTWGEHSRMTHVSPLAYRSKEWEIRL